MRRAAAALALMALLAPQGSAAQAPGQGEIMLTLPRPVGAGETAFVEVQVGAIGRGQRVEVATAAGRSLGVISPFGVRAGQDAGSYTVPIPAEAICDGRVALRLTIRQGETARAPTADEVRGVKLNVAGAR